MPEIAAGRSGLRPRRAPATPLPELFPELLPELLAESAAEAGGTAGSAGATGPVAAEDTVVTGITIDSRLVQPGDLYVALPGVSRHGAQFAAAAVAAGAVAVLTDPAGRAQLSVGVPVAVREDPRRGLGDLSALVYGRPSRQLLMFGITGTNGKTTTAHLLADALRGTGCRTGVVGTLGFSVDGEPLTGPRTTITTPEAPELQALLAVMVEHGAEAVVMEVSSHALTLGRADGVVFDVVAFTNLGRDHLDFHGDLESYFEAKAQLFTPQRARRAVVSVDDPRGRVLVERIRRAPTDVPVSTVSTVDPDADYRLLTATPTDGGALDVLAGTPAGELSFRLGLPGDFNVRNALTALAMVDRAGRDLPAAAAALATAAVPGRMEPVRLGPAGPAVVVDFAHTPQAVASLLAALAGRRRVAVLGSGGDRDPDKREPMGAAAVAAAELVVVTDDNPRSEDPELIRAAVLRGAYAERGRQAARGRPVEVVDGGERRAAISYALTHADRDDVVAVLGKGHETGQEVAGRIHPFDDREVVRAVWAELTAAHRAPEHSRPADHALTNEHARTNEPGQPPQPAGGPGDAVEAPR